MNSTAGGGAASGTQAAACKYFWKWYTVPCTQYVTLYRLELLGHPLQCTCLLHIQVTGVDLEQVML
jgi:hypothetical protein